MKSVNITNWYCPIFCRNIAEGKCLDINYERLGFLADGCLREIFDLTGKKSDEVNKTCEACPNRPDVGV